MTLTLRKRLLIGITPVLAIVVGLGLWAVVMLLRLGGNIDVILRENYRSVIAAQDMKEALDRMDSALWFDTGGQPERARNQFAASRARFEQALRVEQNNITLPGEQAMADDLDALHGRYQRSASRFFGTADLDARRSLYFAEVLPAFEQIQARADDVLRLNQANIQEMDRRARAAAGSSVRTMALALTVAAALATVSAAWLSRSILGPIRAVTEAAGRVAGGDLGQVVPVMSRDELGELASAFNAMARRIREFQQAGTSRLLRAQQTAQATIDAFPDPVVVVDPSGLVERANPAARRLLDVAPFEGGSIPWGPPAPLAPTLAKVLGGGPDAVPTSFEHAIALRSAGHDHHFLPRILAIRDQDQGLLGAAVVLSEVTRFRVLDQLKSDLVATVSHELKTPLTSLQMAVHLLLEEVVGPLNPRQLDLLIAARQDAERLLAMVDDLLDLSRVEQGRVAMDLRPVDPAELVASAVERHEARAKDLGVALATAVEPNLPAIPADAERAAHVFDNLLGNSLNHTPRGGTIKLSAVLDGGQVRFAVVDTGDGIAPEALPRVFEKFYRAPGTDRRGAGLGLAIAKEIVDAHGGRIEVQSERGEGATVAFTLGDINT